MFIVFFYFDQIKVDIAEGTHNTADEINKQLADKERVAAALENPALLKLVNECLLPSVLVNGDYTQMMGDRTAMAQEDDSDVD